MAADVERSGLDELAGAEPHGAGVPVDREDVRPGHGLRDDGRRHRAAPPPILEDGKECWKYEKFTE